MQIQISWLLQKPTDLDLHCLQNRIYPGSAGQGLRNLYVQVTSTLKCSLRDDEIRFELDTNIFGKLSKKL